MIEINLLPGASKKKRSRSGGGLDLRTLATEWGNKVKDPYLIGAVSSVIVGIGAIAFMFLHQGKQETDLNAKLEKVQTDSVRFAAVLKEQIHTAAKRDSVLRQLRVIRSIDNNRFVWSHVMDEVSASLPAYTWLVSLDQTSAPPLPAAATPAPVAGAAKDTTAKPKKVVSEVEAEEAPISFKLVGNTVDIQALTHFMKTLEGSPFIQNVQLTRSELIVLDGKEVTRFELSGEYQKPDPSALKLVPLSETVR